MSKYFLVNGNRAYIEKKRKRRAERNQQRRISNLDEVVNELRTNIIDDCADHKKKDDNEGKAKKQRKANIYLV